jgi:hypothetical protein
MGMGFGRGQANALRCELELSRDLGADARSQRPRHGRARIVHSAAPIRITPRTQGCSAPLSVCGAAHLFITLLKYMTSSTNVQSILTMHTRIRTLPQHAPNTHHPTHPHPLHPQRTLQRRRPPKRPTNPLAPLPPCSPTLPPTHGPTLYPAAPPPNPARA